MQSFLCSHTVQCSIFKLCLSSTCFRFRLDLSTGRSGDVQLVRTEWFKATDTGLWTLKHSPTLNHRAVWFIDGCDIRLSTYFWRCSMFWIPGFAVLSNHWTVTCWDTHNIIVPIVQCDLVTYWQHWPCRFLTHILYSVWSPIGTPRTPHSSMFSPLWAWLCSLLPATAPPVNMNPVLSEMCDKEVIVVYSAARSWISPSFSLWSVHFWFLHFVRAENSTQSFICKAVGELAGTLCADVF